MRDVFEEVYDSMLGQLVEECSLPWVNNIAYQGSEYEMDYSQMLEACQRLYDRLGVQDTDADVESIRCAYESMQKTVCRQMFANGAAYAYIRKGNGQ